MKIEQLMEAWNLAHLGLKSKKEEPKKSTLKLEKEAEKPAYLDGVKETTSAEDNLETAYKRVYDSFYNLIDIANGNKVGGKQSTQKDYAIAYKNLILNIDKAIAVEKKTPGKVKIEDMSKLRNKLLNYSPDEFNIADIEKEWNLAPKVGDKNFPIGGENNLLRTDLLPKTIKYKDIPGTDLGLKDKAKEFATINGKTDAKLMSIFFQKMKKAKEENKDPEEVLVLEPERMVGKKTNHRKELVDELHKLGNLIPEIRMKQINFHNFYKANPNASDSKILNDLIKAAGYDFAVDSNAKVNLNIVKRFTNLINDKNTTEKDVEKFVDSLNKVSGAKEAKDRTRVDKDEAIKAGKTGNRRYYTGQYNVERNKGINERAKIFLNIETKEDYLNFFKIPTGGAKELKEETLFFGSMPMPIKGKSKDKEYITRPNTEGYLVFSKMKKIDDQLFITIDNEVWYGYCIVRKTVVKARALSNENPLTGKPGKGKMKDLTPEQKTLVIKAIKEKAGVASVKTETPIFNY